MTRNDFKNQCYFEARPILKGILSKIVFYMLSMAYSFFNQRTNTKVDLEY